MAGTAERQALKRAAMLALDESRASLGGELSRLRVQWSPRELVRHSLAKHKVAVMIAAALASLVVVRFFMAPASGPGRQRGWQSLLGGKIGGFVTAALWAALRQPLMDFAKSRFPFYFPHPNPSPVDEPSR